MLLFITNSALGDVLPDELFNIKLMSNVSSLKGDISQGKGIVQIKGIPYVYYAVDNKHYDTNGTFQNILVQVKKADGTISSIIGESKFPETECLPKLQEYKAIIEKEYNIQFDKNAHQSDTYYSLVQDNKILLLICEIKREAKLKLILGKL